MVLELLKESDLILSNDSVEVIIDKVRHARFKRLHVISYRISSSFGLKLYRHLRKQT